MSQRRFHQRNSFSLVGNRRKVSESTNKNSIPATSFVKAHIVQFTETQTKQEQSVETNTKTNIHDWSLDSCSGRMISEELNWILLWLLASELLSSRTCWHTGGVSVLHREGITGPHPSLYSTDCFALRGKTLLKEPLM